MARILVVDDDRRVLDILLRALGRFGHDITPARDAEAGLDTLRQGGRFDVIVSDVRMPGLSGLDLLREARTLAPGVPVILMSGIWMSDEREEAEALGARAILTKPVDLGVLESAIALAVAEPQGPGRPASPGPTGAPAAPAASPPAPAHPGNGHSTLPPQAAAVAAPSITRSGTAIPVVTLPASPPAPPPSPSAAAASPPPPPPPPPPPHPHAHPPPPPPPPIAPPPPVAFHPGEMPAAGVAPAPDPRGGPASVLVIEQDVTVRRLLAYCLSREGYRVVAVADAGAAAARLGAESFDAAIVDASEVVALPPGPYVVCLHEPGSPVEAVDALESGADALVQRPLEPEVLFAQLRAGLRRRAASRGHGHGGEGRRGPNGGSGARPQLMRPAS